MSKVRLYFPKDQISDSLNIEDKAVLHKTRDVISLKSGELVFVFDGEGKEYRYKIDEINRKRISLKKEGLERSENAIRKKIILAVPLLKEQKFELILQKAIELGASSFQPFICERSIRENPSFGKKKRWEKIIQEATRQSQRLWIPKIEETVNFELLIKQDFMLKLACSIDGENIKDIAFEKCEQVLILIGPEGDFSPSEYKDLKNHNFRFLKLAEDILRVETASIFAAGIVSYFFNPTQKS